MTIFSSLFSPAADFYQRPRPTGHCPTPVWLLGHMLKAIIIPHVQRSWEQISHLRTGRSERPVTRTSCVLRHNTCERVRWPWASTGVR